ncbi:MAG: hypothetical protein LN569_03855 [Rickettsia endosymbiont of Labidopullus appendiculatus]|nr:hypothetical protein [Rickettsia endosymbiont of Labidopullus appendiculatus]
MVRPTHKVEKSSENKISKKHLHEVTYLMHNILRLEIEEALINDQMTLEKLPEVWNWQRCVDWL